MADKDDRRRRDDDDRRDDRDDDRRDDDRQDDDDRRDDDRDGRSSRRSRRDAAAEAASYRRKLREAEGERDELRERLERLEAGGKGKADDAEVERQVRDAVRAREQELQAQHRQELARLRVEVLAASKLHDPEDVRLLDLDELAELADDPRALKRAAQDALDELLERKPYLARDRGDGDDDRGDRGGDRGGDRDDDRRERLSRVASSGSRGERDRDRDRGSGDSSGWLRKAARR